MTEVARLLSRSCTTGWADWIHGELWLLPTALVRRRLNLATTVANGLGPTVGYPLPEIPVRTLDAEQILATHRTNKVICFDDIAHVRVMGGRTADCVRIVTKSGQRHKLLWLPRDPARAILSEVLHGWTDEASLGTRWLVLWWAMDAARLTASPPSPTGPRSARAHHAPSAARSLPAAPEPTRPARRR